MREHEPLLPLAVGEVKFSLRVEEDIFPLEHFELVVGHNISEGTDLGGVLEDTRAFDVEKDVSHGFGTISFFPPK